MKKNKVINKQQILKIKILRITFYTRTKVEDTLGALDAMERRGSLPKLGKMLGLCEIKFKRHV